jgi:hypothetical protein
MNNPSFFGLSKDDNYTLKYKGVLQALGTRYGINTGNAAIRVTHVGLYGPPSATDRNNSTVFMEDAFTGRQVIGYGTQVDRPRCGFKTAALQAMRWFSAANYEVDENGHIAYLRVGESLTCLVDANLDLYMLVVKGVYRPSRVTGTC